MPRGMDERFEDPSEEENDLEEEPDEGDEGDTTARPRRKKENDSIGSDSSPSPSDDQVTDEPEREETDGDEDKQLNIREDWDSATIYVEPEQSEDIEVAFTRLKKQLKRENITLEKNKHFYRGIFEIAFDEHREETIERISQLARQDIDS